MASAHVPRLREHPMECPVCGAHTRVTDSRPAPDNTIRRRRECVSCWFRVTTYEWIAKDDALPWQASPRYPDLAEAVRDAEAALARVKSVVAAETTTDLTEVRRLHGLLP